MVATFATLPVQLAQQDPFFSSVERAKRVSKWLTDIQDEEWFVDPLTSKDTDIAQSGALDPDECVALAAQRPSYGSIGYEPVTHQRIAPNDFHAAHRSFRDEWWCIRGVLEGPDAVGTKPVVWLLHRHSEVPNATRATSLVDISITVGTDHHHSTGYHPEGTGFINLDTNLHVKCGRDSIVNASDAHMFPIGFSWERLHLTLDKTKPLAMFKSNGTVPSAPGIKYYMYPSVEGPGTWKGTPIQFSGVVEHWWGNGTNSASTSAIGRSFDMVMRDLVAPSTSTMDTKHLVMSIGGATIVANAVLSTDVLAKSSTDALHIDQQGHAKIVTIEIESHGPDVFLVDALDMRCKVSMENGSSGQVRLLNEAMPQGPTGWCNVSQNRQGKLGNVANAANTSNAANAATSTPKNTLAWLVWTIPLIVFVVLLIVCIVVIYIRKGQRKPWVKPYKSLFG